MHDDPTIPMTSPPSPTEPAGADKLPRQLGSVKLLREIGRGGMGVVWLGRDELLDREVAVKFLLNAEAASDDPDFAEFLEGARAATAVRHLGLTAVYQADLAENVPYLVMEYIDGPTLADVLKQTGALSVPAALAAVHSIGDAVGELHDHGILHRDIKPGNVLLDLEGRTFVTDFGLACARPLVGATGLREARVAGTPPYMAPEIFNGLASPRSDVYALGITAFQLLTGQLPFTGELAKLREQHRAAPLPVEFLQQRHINAALIEVLERATHKDAMFRHKTAQYFLRALAEAGANTALLNQGAAELATLATRCRAAIADPNATSKGEAAAQSPASPSAPDPLKPPSTDSSSFYEHLATKAAYKRQEPSLSSAAQSVVSIAPATDSTRRGIQVDLPCVACNYNLRTLDAAGKCPECGGEVAASLKRDRLLFADPRWLARVERGLQFCTVALAIVLLAFPVFTMTGMLNHLTEEKFVPLLMVTFLAGASFGLASVFLVTARDRNAPHTRGLTALRWITRGAALYFFINAAFGTLELFAPSPPPSQIAPNESPAQKPSADEMMPAIIALINSITALLLVIGFLTCLANVARRALQRRLATSIYALAFLIPAFFLFSMIMNKNKEEMLKILAFGGFFLFLLWFLAVLRHSRAVIRRTQKEAVAYEDVLNEQEGRNTAPA